MKDCRIPGYFDTKYIAVLWIEHILHNFEDQKIANLFNLEWVNFRVTLVIYEKVMRCDIFMNEVSCIKHSLFCWFPVNEVAVDLWSNTMAME